MWYVVFGMSVSAELEREDGNGNGNGGILYDTSCTLVKRLFWHGVWALLGGKEVKRWFSRGRERA